LPRYIELYTHSVCYNNKNHQDCKVTRYKNGMIFGQSIELKMKRKTLAILIASALSISSFATTNVLAFEQDTLTILQKIINST
jgi:hypothetical protein